MARSAHALFRPFFSSLVAAALALPGCGAPEEAVDDEPGYAGDYDELTSNTALARSLKFDGVVYVPVGSSATAILETVRDQTQSAFGALRTATVGVNSRELKDVDPKTFVKKDVAVVDVANATATPRVMTQVKYTYTDTALVPKTMAYRSSLSLGVFGADYQRQSSRILTECTDNDDEAHEFQDSIWYVFNPSLSKCKTAMATEQKKIDADNAKLKDKTTQVPSSEVNRLYRPMTAALTGDKTNRAVTYPEYHRLYAGGIQKNRLIIGMVHGMMSDWAAGEMKDTIDDDGYKMWFQETREIFNARGFKLTKIEPTEDISSYTIGNVKVTGVTFNDIMGWELYGTGYPSGITTATQKRALRVAAGDKIAKHWLTFEAPVKVKIGSTTNPVVIQLNSYFGAETDSTPHKRAIKTSDVFIYNGHSYIGYGPLDPTNFRSTDFPSSYQILFINGCVSFNYYEKDYFPLKKYGTRNMELITNGLESWVSGSGPAMGRFVAALINGKQENYFSLLRAAEFQGLGYQWGQDALRVVDGELDNKYDPAAQPITITNQ